ncbi:TonB-dependent receptor [Fibrisoma montanum]|uniref:TonB-dependent receptor n=1 Tax=Fibrisoma montanum TaxID=2305895 RepID=A0A418M702_9BACT|nr:TonB-dependent receptor [Fibrisoma montanum]RIV21535.1 TonB-dependent receptor [Fibrisoma montanum]
MIRIPVYFVFLILVSTNPTRIFAQSDTARSQPTIRTQFLEPVTIRQPRFRSVESLPDVYGTYLMAGKRSEVIRLASFDVNVAEKTGRQIFARIPGVFVYDMDGTGNQINIATRGLDPHRSWELNVRQNGIVTNSDLYGYPASHYSPPLESIDRVELVRGTTSLQYGSQFGGMINYVTKGADTTRAIGVETITSVGSYGVRSTYNALGGRIGKWTYYVYDYRRHSDGYRQNSRSDAQAQFASLHYQASNRLRLRAELGRSTYRYQIPGPLTDSMFVQNPRQSTRSRNYFSPDIWVPSLRLDWQLTDRTQLVWTTSALLGTRSSVQFDAFATVADAIDPQTGQYKPRQVDIDRFNSYTSELRLLHRYALLNREAALAIGVQGINNDLHRRQLGLGSTGTDYDLTLAEGTGWGRDLHFRTRNVAVFAENQLRLTSRFTVSAGIRAENGASRMSGTIRYYAPADVPNTIAHRFVLAGVNAQYRFNDAVRIYGGWSQAYRPVLFKDIIPASVYERVAPTLKDATGFNAELGIEGHWQALRIHVTLFDLLYRNRMGNLVTTDPAGQSLVLRTNIGDSRNQGVEALVEADLVRTRRMGVQVFSSTAYIDARYVNASLSDGKENAVINGNRVESVPVWTSRNGLVVRYGRVRLTTLYSYVGPTVSDALNTRVPTANGARGPVPAYSLWDVTVSCRLNRHVLIRGSLNNLLNRPYFTKRPTFYPGPGIWPSDGRSGVVTVGFTV